MALFPLIAVAAATQDIRDIRGPKALPDWWRAYVLVAAIVLVLCGGYLLWRRRHRAVPPRALTLAERTLQRLETTRALMQSGTARSFGIAASDVLRDYIEQRFAVRATQRTTEEFLQTLLQSSNEGLLRHRELLAEFLQQCDLVKFAGDSVAVNELETLYQGARRFVLGTSEAPAA